MIVPLQVRLVNTYADMYVTTFLRDLSFGSAMNGGYTVCNLELDRPLRSVPAEVTAYTKVYVYDGRNANLVWEGRLEDPGRGSGPDGEVWSLTAVGGAAHAEDDGGPVVYADTIDFGQLQRAGSSKRAGDAGEDVDAASDEAAYRIMFHPGFVAATNDEASVLYLTLRETGQTLARFSYSWDAGRTSADWRVRAKTYPSGTTTRDDAFSTAGGASSARRMTTNFPATDSYLKLMIQYTGGGGQITVDTTYAIFKGVYVIGSRVNELGVALTSADYSKATVNAEDVVRDLLGRWLPRFEVGSIAPGGFEMDHLSYIDGTTPAKVLEDLVRVEGTKTWAVWESNPATGKYPFHWTTLPATVRFEASAADGFSSPGSTLDLRNRWVGRWLDRKGRIRWTTRTRAVGVLTEAGLTRTHRENLGDEPGSAANAAQIGDAFLTEHAYPPNAGTLTVNRPVFDVVLGRMVQPWELVRLAPGNLIRVRDVAPRVDALNVSSRDGVTVFRVVGVTYSPDGGAVLDLDSTPRRMSAVLADIRRAFQRRRLR